MNMETHIEATKTYFLLKIIKKVSFFNFLDKKCQPLHAYLSVKNVPSTLFCNMPANA